MKKVYVLLLLTANIIALSCMERQREKSYDDDDVTSIPLQIFTVNPYAPVHPDNANQYYWQHSSYPKADEPGWQFLEDISNMSYSNRTDATDLTPIYRQSNKATEQQEKKSLLRKNNSLRLDENIMKSLHIKAMHVIVQEYQHKVSQKDHVQKLVELINLMNNARSSGIHEDLMGQFACNDKQGGIYIGDVNIKPLTPLFFILLKKYTLRVQATGEQLPFYPEEELSLEKITLHPNINDFSLSKNPIHDLIHYPAFLSLAHTLRYALQELSLEAIDTLINYLYGNQKILLHSSQGYYINLKNEFYTNTYNMLFNKGRVHLLCHLIQMIDNAKKKHDINSEDDLASGIIGFAFDQPIEALFLSFFNSSYYPENIKKRVVLFCTLAKEYNNARLNKITPTAAQCEVYVVKKDLDIAIPDASLFNEDQYALTEFTNLIGATSFLIDANEDEVNESFNQLYPQKKTLK